MRVWLVTLGIVLAGASAALFTSCEVDSASGTERQVQGSVAGLYRGTDGGAIVSGNSGSPIRTLDLRQAGDQLEAIDNNGLVFRGTLSGESTPFPFTMEGQTTAGKTGYMSGNISIDGSSSSMRGPWIEDDRYGTVSGEANVAASTNLNPVLDPDNWQGCCSDHGGLQLDSNGQVVVDSQGFARCNDGTQSPTCNLNNR